MAGCSNDNDDDDVGEASNGDSVSLDCGCWSCFGGWASFAVVGLLLLREFGGGGPLLLERFVLFFFFPICCSTLGLETVRTDVPVGDTRERE
jgi:hypothetical protein